MHACLKFALLLSASLLPAIGYAQQPVDAPAETAIRRYLAVPTGGISLWAHRTDTYHTRRLDTGRKLYVQTAPDTTWFRVLLAGNSYFVRQREMPVPGWQAGK
ncbi:MAG: hypothetical protein H7330_10520 [Hymenobacteraceae bacterium]|nr:hypothetical protein [Hymenobacteraceae bacterium]